MRWAVGNWCYRSALGAMCVVLVAAVGSCAGSLSHGDNPPGAGVNLAPVIIGDLIAASLTNPETGQSVKFSISTSDPENKATSNTWSDGNTTDGEFTGSGNDVFWATGEAGTYTITVSVMDPGGLIDTATTVITVHEAPVVTPNTPPVFSQDGVKSDVAAPIAGQSIKFTASAVDAEGDPVSFIWTDSTGKSSNFSAAAVDDQGVASVFWTYDLAGTYTITAIANDGRATSAATSAVTAQNTTVTLAARPSTYAFMGAQHCSTCHEEVYDSWKTTQHSTIEADMQAMGRGRSESCRECHDLGWQNGGFIDAELTPQFMSVQCESCHGSGVGHPANGPLPSPGVEPADSCGKCHSGNRHGQFDDGTQTGWISSQHATFDLMQDNTREVNCVKCHNGEWFVRIQINGEAPPAEELEEGAHIGCITCHDPHGSSFEAQLRVDSGAPITLPFRDTVIQAGMGSTCLRCHDGRRTQKNMDDLIAKGGRGPHPNSQGPMLFGIAGYEFSGFPYETQHPHNTWNENKCVTCHMYTSPYDKTTGSAAVKGHTFQARYETCLGCHDNVSSLEEMQAFTAGFQQETQDMLDQIVALWPAEWKDMTNPDEPDLHNRPDPADPPTYDGPPLNDPVGEAYRGVWWNYSFVMDDFSKGIHNPSYTHQLLQSSIAKLQELNAQ